MGCTRADCTFTHRNPRPAAVAHFDTHDAASGAMNPSLVSSSSSSAGAGAKGKLPALLGDAPGSSLMQPGVAGESLRGHMRTGVGGGVGGGAGPAVANTTDAPIQQRKRAAAESNNVSVAEGVASDSEGSADGWGVNNIAAKRLKALATRGVVKKHVELRPPKRHDESLVLAKA